MKTPQEIFKKVITDLGFENYKQSEMTNSDNWLCTITAMQEYAQQCCDEQIASCAENSKLKPVPNCTYKGILQIIDKYSILNTPNVVTTNTK